MDTIVCDGEEIKVSEVEQIGGDLNATTEFTDTLYRGRAGQYFLEEERTEPLPLNARHDWPRDRELIERMKNKEISVKQVSERNARRARTDRCHGPH
jgi:hypothetical protein